MSRVSITTPLPATASIGIENGKLRVEVEVDLAAEVGRAVLEGRGVDTGAVRRAVIAAVQALGVAEAVPKGTA